VGGGDAEKAQTAAAIGAVRSIEHEITGDVERHGPLEVQLSAGYDALAVAVHDRKTPCG